MLNLVKFKFSVVVDQYNVGLCFTIAFCALLQKSALFNTKVFSKFAFCSLDKTLCVPVFDCKLCYFFCHIVACAVYVDVYYRRGVI